MTHTWELGDVKMKAMPIPQPPSPTMPRSNQPIRRGAAADLRVDVAQQRAARDDLGVRVVDDVPAGAEHRGTEALGACAHGEDSEAARVMRGGGEEEGGENRGLAPLRLPFLGQGAIVPERCRGRGFHPGGGGSGALLWRRRGGGQHGQRRWVVESRESTEISVVSASPSSLCWARREQHLAQHVELGVPRPKSAPESIN